MRAPGAQARIAYLATHPIQYQAPLLRRINAAADIELTAFFATDFSVRPFAAKDFGRTIEWDVPLLEGYEHGVLPSIGGSDEGDIGFWTPLNYGLRKRLAAGAFDVLWVHGYARAAHLAAILGARRRGISVLLRDEATAVSTSRGRLKRAGKRGFFEGLNRVVDAFLAIGSLNRSYYVDNGIDPGKIFDVPYAVDNERFTALARAASVRRDELRKALGLAGERPVLLYAGKLVERKRPDLLIEAVRRLHMASITPRPYLVVVGDGPLRRSLEAASQTLEAGSLTFAGFQGQQELPRYYDLADVFVLPSEREPWGLVVNEAMCAGCAVIASDHVGAAADLVRPGWNGAVFRSGDASDLAAAIKGVVGEPERLTRMGAHSLDLIRRWGLDEDVRGLRAALAHLGIVAPRG
jgi:glycosyltransferase involved in cell wall biosynthesis